MPLDDSTTLTPAQRQLAKFWWVFAVRGGSAILFGCALAFAASLLGTLFFDPVMLVFLSLLLGFFVLGNGVLLAIAAAFAHEQRLALGWLLFAESLFAIALGVYIAFSVRIEPQSLAWLAGLAALGSGFFQVVLSIRTRNLGHNPLLMRTAAALSLSAATAFLLHPSATTRTTAHWLAVFEFLAGTLWLLFAINLHRRALKLPTAG